MKIPPGPLVYGWCSSLPAEGAALVWLGGDSTVTLRLKAVLACLSLVGPLFVAGCTGCDEDPLAGGLRGGRSDAAPDAGDAGTRDGAMPVDAAPDLGRELDAEAPLDSSRDGATDTAPDLAVDADLVGDAASDQGLQQDAGTDGGPPTDAGPALDGGETDAGPPLVVVPPFGWDGPLRLPAAPVQGASIRDTSWFCLSNGWVKPITSAPARLIPLAPLVLDGACQDVATDTIDERLWVAQGADGVVELDVAQPEEPEVVQVVATEQPAVICVHDDLWDWIYLVTRGADGDRILRLDGSGAENGTVLATSEPVGVRVAHLVTTPQRVVVIGEQGTVLACPHATLRPTPVPIDDLPGPAVGASASGDDVLVAYPDRVVRLREQGDQLVSLGPLPGMPRRLRTWNGRGPVGICGCGPDGRGVGVIRTHMPGAPGSVESIGQLEGAEASFTLATRGGAWVAWGSELGRLDVPPLVSRLEPAAGTRGCRPHCAVEVGFSEPVTAAADDFELVGPDGAVATELHTVPGEDDATYWLGPDTLLAPEATYTASVATTISDTGGLGLWPDEQPTRASFDTGPAIATSPLEPGGTMPLGTVGGLDTDGESVAACTTGGRFQLDRLEAGRPERGGKRQRVAGPCAALKLDSERQQAYVALRDNGLAVVDTGGDPPRRPRRLKPPRRGSCRALGAALQVGTLYSVCGDGLQQWSLGPAGERTRPLLERDTDAGLAEGPAFVEVLEEHVVVLDGAGTLSSFSREDLRLLDVAGGVAAPTGLGAAEGALIVQAPQRGAGAELQRVPIDAGGRFGAPTTELAMPGLTSFGVAGRLLATTVDGTEVGLHGRAQRQGEATWLPLGGRHPYPSPASGRAVTGGALVTHAGGWSLLDAPPFVVQAWPAPDAEQLPLDVIPEAHYSEPLQDTTGALSLWQGEDEVPTILTVSDDRRDVRLRPESPLLPEMPYSLQLGDEPTDRLEQRVRPPGGSRRTIRTGRRHPASCDDLDCASTGRSCAVERGVAECQGCLPDHHEAGDGPCVPDTCDDVDCAGQRRECLDADPPARCGGCLAGQREADGWCVPETCGDLECASRQRACLDDGPFATCGECLQGYHEAAGACAPDTCGDLDCAGAHRSCDADTLPATCGGCEPGYHPVGDACHADTCDDLDCAAAGRSCDDAGPHARCGGCLPGHVEAGEQCIPADCALLGCDAAHRECVVVGAAGRCGECLAGYHAAGDACAADACVDLDCAAVGRLCDDRGPFARCGGCVAGHVLDGGVCRPAGCAELGCGVWHRACDDEAALPACGGCLPGYVEEGARCRPVTCAELDCATSLRVCDDTGPFAGCAGCLPGAQLAGDACVPTTCADLDCEADLRSCDPAGAAAGASCGGCLPDHHDDGGACVPDTCESLGCAAQGRICADEQAPVGCGGCLEGFRPDGAGCRPATCDDLDCAILLQRCDDSGPFARCDGCAAGHYEDDGACWPHTCASLGCANDGRACADDAEPVECGGCLPGYRDEAGACQPDACADLDCAAEQRRCDDSGPFAECTGCLPTYVEREGVCVPDGCAEAGCADDHRICDSWGDETRCTGCLPDYFEQDGGCLPGPCAERQCGPDGAGGSCGLCGPGEYCSAAASCLPVNGGGGGISGEPRTIYLDQETLLPERVAPDLVVRPVLAIDGPRVLVEGDLEGIEPGDEVMIINLQGQPGGSETAGAYELGAVQALEPGTATVTLHWPLSRALVPEGVEGLGGQRLALLRVPHYGELTLPEGWTLTASAFDGRSGGVLAFAVDGPLTLEPGATVTMDGSGYRGGAGGSGGCNVGSACAHGVQGESIAGAGARRGTANDGGGGGGNTHRSGPGDWGDGGGGGSAVALGASGAGGTLAGGALEPHGPLRLLLGSGGGGGGADGVNLGSDLHSAGAGARGGGVIHLRALALDNGGVIRARGADGNDVGSLPSTPGYEAGAGGAGAGGTVYVHAPGRAAAERSCTLMEGLGTAEATPAFDGGGAYLDFVGPGQHAQCAPVTRLGDPAADWSVLAWVRRAEGLPAGTIYSEAAADGDGEVRLSITADGRLRLQVTDAQGRTASVQSDPGAAGDGDWHMATAVRSARTLRLYLDGRAAAASSASLGSFVAGSVTLGARAAAPGEPAAEPLVGGQLDEVAVFGHALTAERVAALHFHALHDLHPWEVRVTQRQPGAFWRSETRGQQLLDHAEARPGFGRLDVRGGAASASCRAYCGGAGGAGRLVLARSVWDVEPDGVGDGVDVCFAAHDPDQGDRDGDGTGDRCEDDWDGDGVIDPYDAFPRDPDEWADGDGDGVGDRRDCAPADPAVQVPDCEGRRCGPDGCGGSCGVGCALDEYCDLSDGQCVHFDVQPPAEVVGTVSLDQVSLTPGRETPDMAIYSVASVDGTHVTATAVLDAIAPGDEVLIINQRGAAAASTRVGLAERAFVARVEGAELWLGAPIRSTFGPNGNDDLPGQGQAVNLLRIPHYAAVTVRSGGQITASAWDGARGGVLVFAVDGPLQIDSGGLINMNGAGYRGGRAGAGGTAHGSAAARGVQGEGVGGTGGVSTGENRSGGGGGVTVSDGGDWGTGGGGGGNGANGAGAGGAGGRRHQLGATPAFLFLGGGGGGGGADPSGWGDTASGTAGARGGGIVMLRARSWSNAGTVRANGSQASRPGCTPGTSGNEPAGGGSGAGGTVLLELPATADPDGSCSLVGAPRVGVPGALLERDGAATFDGLLDAAQCGAESHLARGESAWTISAWLQARPGATGYLYSETGEHPPSNGYLGLALGAVNEGGAATRVSLLAADSAQRSYALTSPPGVPVDDARWHFVVGTYDDGELALYLDGEAVGQGRGELEAVPVVATALAARTGAGAQDERFEGTLDEVALFTSALTAEQVAALYADSQTPGRDYEQRVLDYGPSAYWRLGTTEAGAFASGVQVPPELGAVTADGGPRGSCSCGCGGAGGAGFVHVTLGVDDLDGDEVPDAEDNCFAAANSQQEDGDADGLGDVCDPAPRTHPYGGSAAEPGASCADIRDAVPVPLDGLAWVDPDGDGAAAAVQVYCDQTSEGGGWTLLLAYAHDAGSNDPLDGATLPLDPELGYSHATLGALGFDEGDVTALRLRCNEEGSEASVDFVTSARAALDAALDGEPTWEVGDWTGDDVTLGAQHAASLPLSADGVELTPGAGFTGQPFFQRGVAYWAIQAEGDRWGCDSAAPGPATTTLHQVWFR